MRTSKLVKTIVSSKNPKFLTVVTVDGSTYPVAKAFVDALKARGQNMEMVEVEPFKAGDYIFGTDENGKPSPATRDSSRLWDSTMPGFDPANNGNPVYVKGEFPKYTTPGTKVVGFMESQVYINSLKIQKLERELAALSI